MTILRGRSHLKMAMETYKSANDFKIKTKKMVSLKRVRVKLRQEIRVLVFLNILL